MYRGSNGGVWNGGAGAFADGVSGIYAARDTGDEVVFDAGSGSYVFQLTGW